MDYTITNELTAWWDLSVQMFNKNNNNNKKKKKKKDNNNNKNIQFYIFTKKVPLSHVTNILKAKHSYNIAQMELSCHSPDLLLYVVTEQLM